VILEAQASGLPVVAVAEGGPLSLVEDRATGLLRAPQAGALAAGVCELAASSKLRSQLAESALAAVQQRTWEASLARLAAGYGSVLADPATTGPHAVAA
jgi:glycosyltransferase involved in cell wall biosynthesis